MKSINNCSFDNLYNNFNLRQSHSIGTLSSLDFLIETTYYSDYRLKNIMLDDKNILKSYCLKFRSVRGDGDCFYRSLIFEFLENAILSDHIMLMKEILILFNIIKCLKKIKQNKYL